MYSYQKNSRYFAQVADDTKELAAIELRNLGAKSVDLTYKGIYFNAKQKDLYRINLQSSLVNRVLAPLLTFDCHSDRYLYKTAHQIRWLDFLTSYQTFAIFSTVSDSKISHSKFASLRLKDAIVDYFRSVTGLRPSVDTKKPDLWLNLRIHRNRATISVDTSGGSLHQRRYRKESVEAPMIETLAAALLKASGWDQSQPLYDPFCGSGTLLCEAYLQATGTPANGLRTLFGFERLPDFDPRIWKEVQKECHKKQRAVRNGLIAGSDISQKAVATSRRNTNILTTDRRISVQQKDVFHLDKLQGQFIITNPPYGIRLGRSEDLSHFYQRLGDFLKKQCQGATACIYFGDRKYIKHIGLRSSWKKPFTNGGLDGRLVKYELY